MGDPKLNQDNTSDNKQNTDGVVLKVYWIKIKTCYFSTKARSLSMEKSVICKS